MPSQVIFEESLYYKRQKIFMEEPAYKIYQSWIIIKKSEEALSHFIFNSFERHKRKVCGNVAPPPVLKLPQQPGQQHFG